MGVSFLSNSGVLRAGRGESFFIVKEVILLYACYFLNFIFPWTVYLGRYSFIPCLRMNRQLHDINILVSDQMLLSFFLFSFKQQNRKRVSIPIKYPHSWPQPILSTTKSPITGQNMESLVLFPPSSFPAAGYLNLRHSSHRLCAQRMPLHMVSLAPFWRSHWQHSQSKPLLAVVRSFPPVL